MRRFNLGKIPGLWFWTIIGVLIFSLYLSAGDVVKGDMARKVDTYLSRIVPYGFSGAFLIAKDGEIVLNKGYGMAIRSQGTANTSETVFSTGSLTKQFTAAGIMKLEMMGKLNTHDPITKYFEGVPEDKQEITLHHLLTHTAGVVDAVGPDFVEALRDPTVEKILKRQLEFPPGQEFSYSNAGYSLLAAIIEKVTGQDYETFQRKQLFLPAGMEYTGYRLPEWDKRLVAHWYVGEHDNGTPLEKPYPYWNLLGNGGILSTTEDMYRWHLALLGEKVLSRAAKNKMFTPVDNDYGYGWDILESDHGLLIKHDGGSSLGSSSELRRYLDAGLVTMLFCNQGFGRMTLMEVVREKTETLVFGGDVEMPLPVKDVVVPDAEKYTGTYTLFGGDQLKINHSQGRLQVRPQGQAAINALLGLGVEAGKRLNNLNKLSVTVFSAALAGDYEPLNAALSHRERRQQPVRDLIEMRLRNYAPRIGKVALVIAHMTMPASLSGIDAAKTFIELKGEKGSIYFGLYWKDGFNIGIEPIMAPPQLDVPFLPLSERAFAGYHLDLGKAFEITFEADKEGRISALVFASDGGKLKAIRQD
ncbi:MAG: serine hydrolase domain-containing protein [Candidatus Aminicenantaceae bacterium]